MARFSNSTRTVWPQGGTADDWALLFSPGGIAAIAVAADQALVLGPGTWRCDSTQQVPRGLSLICAPGVTFASTLPSTGGAGHQNSVFAYDQFTVPLGVTVLGSDATAGGLTISVTTLAGLAAVGSWVGQEILLQDEATNTTNQVMAYVVRAASGSGPYTLTLDRPLLRTWPSSGAGTNVYRGLRAKKINLVGNGAIITGTGDRAISLVAAWDCHAEGFEIDAPGFDAEYSVSFDSGSFQSGYERIRVKSSKATSFALEGGEGLYMRHCYSEYDAPEKSNAAFLVQAGYDVSILDCHGSGRTGGSGAGLLIGFITDIVGSRGVRVEACSFIGNLIGIDISGGSQDVDIIGCDVSFNTGDGIRVQALATPTRTPGRVRIVGGEIRHNGGLGVDVDGCKGVSISAETYIEENTLGGVATVNGGELRVSARIAQSVVGTACAKCNTSTDVLDVSDCTFMGTNAGNGYGLWVADGKCIARNVRCNWTAGSMICIVQTGGALYYDCWTNIGGTVDYGYANTAGTVRRGPFSSFANTTTPISISGSGQCSVGTVTLNGATGVDYSFADVRADDQIRLTRKTAGGTPGAAPTFTITAGSKVTVTGTALDSSTYQIEIG